MIIFELATWILEEILPFEIKALPDWQRSTIEGLLETTAELTNAKIAEKAFTLIFDMMAKYHINVRLRELSWVTRKHYWETKQDEMPEVYSLLTNKLEKLKEERWHIVS